MSAYLKFFEFENSPFDGTTKTQVVLGTKALRAAFGAIREGLDEGADRICVSGGAGLGKTSLAKALPKLLGDNAQVALALDPGGSWESLRGSIARQWGLETAGLARASLVEAARDQRLVLVIDQAETASEEFLDHLDVILSYRGAKDEPVVQSVLLACLVRAEGQDAPPLLWWLDRIHTRQLEFAPLPQDGVESYIHKHLKRAGWRGEQIFSQEAAFAIHEVSDGIPGKISRLCEHLLEAAAAEDRRDIDVAFVQTVCGAIHNDRNEAQNDAQNDAEIKEAPETMLKLEETVEDFEASDSTDPDESLVDSSSAQDSDDSLASLEDYLSAPVSAEELRSIRGSLVSQQVRPIAAAAIAAILGGLAIAWLTGDSETTAAESSRSTGQASRSAPSLDDGRDAPVIARLRGPVTGSQASTNSAERTAAQNPRTVPVIARSPIEKRGRFDFEDQDFAEDIADDELIDMRPASMLPSTP